MQLLLVRRGRNNGADHFTLVGGSKQAGVVWLEEVGESAAAAAAETRTAAVLLLARRAVRTRRTEEAKQ
jgi:ADP-ribose pyrophosphatase YjhB (NUDIX family)